MQFCQRGKELLLDLKRSEWLPPYDDEGLRAVIMEMEDLFLKIYSIAENIELNNITDSKKVTLVYYNQCFIRNRRYSYAYYEYRLSKIRNIRWDTSAVLPSNIRSKLSLRENDYFIEYNNILTDYCNDITIDLTSDFQPPTDLHIEIRVLQNCGEIMTENGPIHLDAGTTHYLRRTDVEHLIRQGRVEHIIND